MNDEMENTSKSLSKIALVEEGCKPMPICGKEENSDIVKMTTNKDDWTHIIKYKYTIIQT